MNQPFKPPIIAEVLADACVSISNLKANPAAVIAAAQERQVAILSRNKPVAYIISPEVWEFLSDIYEDRLDSQLVRERLMAGEVGIPVSLDDLRH
ncbi:MAG: hypothetical protein RLY97_1562 [Pseudomonadota bacterium]|jgi:antitoxin StbD